jgi:hypothetical protein
MTADKIKHALLKTEGYLIFRIEDGQLEDYGLYETRAAAEERMASAGLAVSWKIAAIDCWFHSKPRMRS